MRLRRRSAPTDPAHSPSAVADGAEGSAAALTLTAEEGFAAIQAGEWDALEAAGNPFLSHAFLLALEVSDSASNRTGWIPRPVCLRDAEGRLLAAMPLYAKTHSYGEYVFDHGWAHAWEQAGGSYYPKLQGAIPFTPATGPRLLTAPGIAREAAAQALIQGVEALCARLDLSSAHVTFLPEADLPLFRDAGWMVRQGIQYHWHNQGYADFDGFLEALASRKRKNIRREREKVAESGLILKRLTGDMLQPRHWDRFFRFYRDTVDRKWGQAYLTRGFFRELHERLADRVLLVVAEDPASGEIVAGALNLIGDDTLYGRNWGASVEVPGLHFEACYYQAIEFAIERGLSRVEAGAQGEHKLARGYLPSRTWSVHHIPHPGFRAAVARFLSAETEAVDQAMVAMAAESPYRQGD